MTEIVYSHTDNLDSLEAGTILGKEIHGGLLGSQAHAIILFASNRYEPETLLAGMKETCKPAIIIGCTSAEEFVTGSLGTGSVLALAISIEDIRFSSGLKRDIHKDANRAINEVVTPLRHLFTITVFQAAKSIGSLNGILSLGSASGERVYADCFSPDGFSFGLKERTFFNRNFLARYFHKRNICCIISWFSSYWLLSPLSSVSEG